MAGAGGAGFEAAAWEGQLAEDLLGRPALAGVDAALAGCRKQSCGDSVHPGQPGLAKASFSWVTGVFSEMPLVFILTERLGAK